MIGVESRDPGSRSHKNGTKFAKLGNDLDSKNRKWNLELELGGKRKNDL